MASIATSPSQPFDPSILESPQNSLAAIPVAHIVDTEAYRTSGVPAKPSTLDNIGIAEYSNANFFSDDTILKDYAYPAASSMDLVSEPGPGGPSRLYLRKNRGPGDASGYRAAVASRLFGFLPLGFPTQQWELDDNVLFDYGSHLFPRAIGYSAGLIDYFFRPRMFCPGVIDHLPSARSYDTVRLIQVYLSADQRPSETATQGKLQILGFLTDAQGQIIPGQLLSAPAFDVDLSNQPSSGYEVRIDNVPPDGAFYFCVFKGKLGDEDQAVASGVILEP